MTANNSQRRMEPDQVDPNGNQNRDIDPMTSLKNELLWLLKYKKPKHCK